MYAVQSVERKNEWPKIIRTFMPMIRALKLLTTTVYILNVLHLFWKDVVEYTALVSFNVGRKVRRLQCI